MPELALLVGGRLALLQEQARERQCGEKCSESRVAFSVLRMTFRTRLSSGSVPASVQKTHSGSFDQPRVSVSVLRVNRAGSGSACSRTGRFRLVPNGLQADAVEYEMRFHQPYQLCGKGGGAEVQHAYPMVSVWVSSPPNDAVGGRVAATTRREGR